MISLRRVAFALFLTTALLGVAWILICTRFMVYDDEGYLLITYRDFFAGHALYDEIFSQYGPFPYLYHRLIGNLIGEPITHTTGRLLTCLHWVGCSLACGWMVRRATQSILAGVTATLLVFALLWPMVQEPSHPGGLIAIILSIASLGAFIAAERRNWTAVACILGSASVLLLFTKINIGLFFVTGSGAFALLFTSWPERLRKRASTAAWVGLPLLPWCLMFSRIDHPRIFVFATHFSLCAAGVLWVLTVRREASGPRQRHWLPGAAVAIILLVLIAVVMHAQGTQFSTLLRAVLLEPLRLQANFSTAMRWPVWVWGSTIPCALIVARAGWELRKRGALSSPTQNAVLAMRVVCFGLLALNVFFWIISINTAWMIIAGLNFLPLFLLPLNGQRPRGMTSLSLLALLALPQVLHAFPVAGSQMAWGSFLLLVFFVIGFHDTWEHLRARMPRLAWLGRQGMLALAIVQIGLIAQVGVDQYRDSEPLGLPGCEFTKANPAMRLALRTLNLNATVHADLLFSKPGMFSFNLWSGTPTPTFRNTTQWTWLLKDTEQTAIVERLRQTPRTAFIANSYLNGFIRDLGVPSDGRLSEFLDKNYRVLFTIDTWTFNVPKNSAAVPFGRIELLRASADADEQTAPFLAQAYVAFNGTPDHCALKKLSRPKDSTHRLGGDKDVAYLTPVTPQGQPIGPRLRLPHARTLNGLYRLDVYTTQTIQSPDSVLLLQDKNDRILAEAGS